MKFFTVPKWLRATSKVIAPKAMLDLPSWARVISSPNSVAGRSSICIEANIEGYVKDWFALLGVGETDQYWLEVAYQCAKLDLQTALLGTKFDPLTCGKCAEFIFTRDLKYALARYPAGRGVVAATQGREARTHYIHIRGKLPF